MTNKIQSMCGCADSDCRTCFPGPRWFYGIEMTGGGWWDLFCCRGCAEKVHPGESPELFKFGSFKEQTGVDITNQNRRCFECGGRIGV